MRTKHGYWSTAGKSHEQNIIFPPIFRAFFWGDFPLDHGPKYVLQHFQFKRVNKFMRLSIFHSRKCLSLAVGCEMCLFASFSTRFCFYFFRSFFAVLTFNHSFIYELLIFSLQNECHMYTWHKFSTYFMLIVMYMWVRVRVCIVSFMFHVARLLLTTAAAAAQKSNQIARVTWKQHYTWCWDTALFFLLVCHAKAF